MTGGRQDITLAKLIRDAIDYRLTDVHVSLPGRVETYDSTTQVADIKPLISRVIVDPDGEEIIEELPVIPSVPIIFQRANCFMITFPVIPGDTGQIIFCERSLDQWYAKGGQVDPGESRIHPLDGAVFYPGLSAKPNALLDAHAENLVFGLTNGVQIHIKPDGTISLGEENPTDALSLASLVKADLDLIKTYLDDIKTQFAAHTHVVAAAPGTSSPTTSVIASTYTATDPKSTTVKAK